MKKQLINEQAVPLRRVDLEALECQRKQVEIAPYESPTYAQAMIETVREPLLVLDDHLKVLSASRSFYDTFRVAPGETVGKHIYDLGNGQWNIPGSGNCFGTSLGTRSSITMRLTTCFRPSDINSWFSMPVGSTRKTSAQK